MQLLFAAVSLNSPAMAAVACAGSERGAATRLSSKPV